MIKLAEQYFVNIIRREMDLPNEQIWIRDQNKVLPNDNKLYVVVGVVDSRPFSVTNTVKDVPEGIMEIQKIIMRENIQVDIWSRSRAALDRRYEVIAALRSIYSQQTQESNDFKIFALPGSFVNASDAEGGSNINRFSMVIPCHSWYRKEKLVTGYDYYNDFDTRVDDEQSIGTEHGIIEFNINQQNNAVFIFNDLSQVYNGASKVIL